MAIFHCFYHRQRGMSAPLGFGRNTNSADTNLIIKPIKMKKFLLLLSCFLATWCSVQAGLKSSASSSEMLNSAYAYGQSSGQIKSASYDKNSNTMFVTYSLSGASSAKLRLLQTRTGFVVGEYSLSVNANSTTFRVYTKSDIKHYDRYEYIDEGLYVLLLVVDGKECANMNVTITASGKINSLSPSLDNKKLTVNYTIEHASVYSRTLRIEGSDFRESLPYPNSSNSYTFDSSKLTPAKTYTFKLYSGDNLLNTKKYTMPMPTAEMAISYVPDNKTYSGTTLHSFTVDYKLKYARKPTLCLYQGGNLIKSMTIANSSANKTITIDNAVDPDNYYQVSICENGKALTSMQLDTHTPAPLSTGITDLVYEKDRDRFWLKFYVTHPGVNVSFQLIPTHGLNGRTFDYNWGYCTLTTTDYYMYLPSGYSYGTYVILYKEDGRIVDSKQIYINK